MVCFICRGLSRHGVSFEADLRHRQSGRARSRRPAHGDAAVELDPEQAVVKQERAERTRETIIRAAATIFERDGFAAAPLSGITRRATVTKGALYFHFSSKRELAHAVISEAAETLQVLLAEARRRRGHQLPLQIVIDLSHALVGRLADDPVLRAGLRLGGDSDLFPERAEGLSVDWSALVDELLHKPGSDADDAEGLNAAAQNGSRANPLAAILSGLELLYRRSPEQIQADTLTSIWLLLLQGLARSGEDSRYDPAGSPEGLAPNQPGS